MFNFFQKEDSKLKDDVLDELKWDPSVTASQISVSVDNGIVSLRGSVPHYFEKSYAEKATRRVSGVRAVADELEVKLMGSYERDDEDIAKAALNALEWNYQVPEGVKVTVEKGWLTLSGEVDWEYERSAAKDAVASLMGVIGVTNDISIKAIKVQASEVKSRIEEALKRSAESEGKKINVTVEGSEVKLSGKVHSVSEVQDARLAAWNAPGVNMVSDDLKIAS
jgi:osmotically-inducible protein OsmY